MTAISPRGAQSGQPLRIVRITGSLAEARPATEAFLYEMALVGERGMLGEVIRLDGDVVTLQVYEDTTGLAVGEPVRLTGNTLTAQLGPGLLGALLDGTGRPLGRLAEMSGDFLGPGLHAPTLDETKLWDFRAVASAGDVVTAGTVLGVVEERPGMEHRILVPPTQSGTIARITRGRFTVGEPIGALEDGTVLTLAHRWPVRLPRPFARRLSGDRPFITGQRVFDFLFPIAEGGSAAVPGGFGTGKTVIEQSLAKFAEADVVVFVGCGERGNEMTDLLTEFPKLIDPRTGRSIMDRAILIVNTSNMPVAAREASIYLGATIAEYYRDMGYRVATMVDSISRWAEALREISARLQEMPGEEGFPPYLASRFGKFVERAGRVTTSGTPPREGAVTIIAAISPPGGDFSEPVTQAAQRVTGALWALDSSLAHQRHFPAVDWSTSYSLYAEACGRWYTDHVAPDWPELRREILNLLERERQLRDVAALVGADALEPRDRLVMDIASLAREVLLRQNVFHPHDASSSTAKTLGIAAAIRALHRAASHAIDGGVAVPPGALEPVRRALQALRDADGASVETLAARAGELAEAIGARAQPRALSLGSVA
jgi:V/A-type H+-transporting ATPase subunit A